jgi:hypothetical protein
MYIKKTITMGLLCAAGITGIYNVCDVVAAADSVVGFRTAINANDLYQASEYFTASIGDDDALQVLLHDLDAISVEERLRIVHSVMNAVDEAGRVSFLRRFMNTKARDIFPIYRHFQNVLRVDGEWDADALIDNLRTLKEKLATQDIKPEEAERFGFLLSLPESLRNDLMFFIESRLEGLRERRDAFHERRMGLLAQIKRAFFGENEAFLRLLNEEDINLKSLLGGVCMFVGNSFMESHALQRFLLMLVQMQQMTAEEMENDLVKLKKALEETAVAEKWCFAIRLPWKVLESTETTVTRDWCFSVRLPGKVQNRLLGLLGRGASVNDMQLYLENCLVDCFRRFCCSGIPALSSKQMELQRVLLNFWVAEDGEFNQRRDELVTSVDSYREQLVSLAKEWLAIPLWDQFGNALASRSFQILLQKQMKQCIRICALEKIKQGFFQQELPQFFQNDGQHRKVVMFSIAERKLPPEIDALSIAFIKGLESNDWQGRLLDFQQNLLERLPNQFSVQLREQVGRNLERKWSLFLLKSQLQAKIEDVFMNVAEGVGESQWLQLATENLTYMHFDCLEMEEAPQEVRAYWGNIMEFRFQIAKSFIKMLQISRETIAQRLNAAGEE